jgi:hypothetical protein
MQPDPDPVWILFRRRTFSRLAYWCLVLGYDFRDRSLTNRFYFVYFILFWLAWVNAVFALLGYTLAGFFGTLALASPTGLVILLGAWALALWGLVQLWQITGHSPFVFSEADAFLLCQAPVRRRCVGAAWFLMDWFGTVLPFAAGAVTLSFALTEASLPPMVTILDLLVYFTASLRALAVVLPLQMGLQAGLWGLGAWRLRRDRTPNWLIWLRLAVLVPGLGLLAALFFPAWRAVVLSPLTVPLQAAFGEVLSPSAWLVRAGLGLLVLALGMAFLLVWTSRMHLGRAAEETRLQSVIRLVQGALNFELAGMLTRQSRMKATCPPSRLPVRSGAWMLTWKDVVQSWRALRASQVLRWVWVFFLGLGFFLTPGWVVQLIIGGLWAVSLGDLVTGRLRSDLARWWLLRSLPLRDSDLLLAQLGPACVLGLLLGWLALALTGPPAPFGWLAAALLPFLVAVTALGTARDILDHARARLLLTPGLTEENVPRQDIQGVFIVLISVGLPLGLLVWGSSLSNGLVWELLSLPAAALITVLLFQSVCSVYRWIG